MSTVKQKDSVTMPPSHILSLSSPSLPPPLPFHSVSSLNFPRLLLMSNTYLVAWQKDNLFLFHPASYSLLWWTNTLEDIVQVECVKEKVCMTMTFVLLIEAKIRTKKALLMSSLNCFTFIPPLPPSPPPPLPPLSSCIFYTMAVRRSLVPPSLTCLIP